MYAVTSSSNNKRVDILALFVINISWFKDILDLKDTVLYLTHLEHATKIEGEKCVVYMHIYDNLPARSPWLPPAVWLAKRLGDHHRDYRLAFHAITAQDKICPKM